MSLLSVCLTVLAAVLLAVLVSYTPWAQQRLKWLTNLYFYVLVGLAFGLLLATVCYEFGDKLAGKL